MTPRLFGIAFGFGSGVGLALPLPSIPPQPAFCSQGLGALAGQACAPRSVKGDVSRPFSFSNPRLGPPPGRGRRARAFSAQAPRSRSAINSVCPAFPGLRGTAPAVQSASLLNLGRAVSCPLGFFSKGAV